MTAVRTGQYAVIGYKLKQNANEGCNSCASHAGLVLCFIVRFVLRVIAPLCQLFYRSLNAERSSLTNSGHTSHALLMMARRGRIVDVLTNCRAVESSL